MYRPSVNGLYSNNGFSNSQFKQYWITLSTGPETVSVTILVHFHWNKENNKWFPHKIYRKSVCMCVLSSVQFHQYIYSGSMVLFIWRKEEKKILAECLFVLVQWSKSWRPRPPRTLFLYSAPLHKLVWTRRSQSTLHSKEKIQLACSCFSKLKSYSPFFLCTV